MLVVEQVQTQKEEEVEAESLKLLEDLLESALDTVKQASNGLPICVKDIIIIILYHNKKTFIFIEKYPNG